MATNRAAGREREEMVGQALERREDPGLLTGEADYTDDLSVPNMVHAAFVRSQYGHAEITGIDASAAEDHEGVVAVFTGEDVVEAGIPGRIPISSGMVDEAIEGHPILARDRVRYQGEPVAVVLAEERYLAHDAADLVEVDYERLDAVVDPVEAGNEDAPTIHEEAPDNTAYEWVVGDPDETDEAFEAADHVTELDLTNNRLVSNYIEPRASLVDYRRGDEKLDVTVTTQNPHKHRLALSNVLDIPEHKIRVRAPEVGGGFGPKGRTYPDDAAVVWAAKELERPVKWVQTRTEHFVADTHGRDHVTHAELALDDDGTIRGLRAETHVTVGGYVMDIAPVVATANYGHLLSGQYEIPAIHGRVTGTFTNTAPVHAYRGAGRPEANYVVERIVDAAARELDIDPVELRRKNFIPEDAFPYETPVVSVYDSGAYEESMEKALELADYEELRERQAELREEGRYLGIGVGCFVESAGSGPSSATGDGISPALYESGLIRFSPSGTVTAYVGTSGHGQGHETTFAQVVADELGVDYEDVEIVEGDTEEVQYGNGTYASRSTSLGGGALVKSAQKVIEKGKQIAAHKLEAPEEDVEFADGEFHVAGAPDRSITITQVAEEAYMAHDLPEGVEPGFEASAFFDPENFTYPFGTHVAVVEIDPDSGEIEFERYVAVDDCGTQINPKLVEGQVHGSLAQGFGQALFEEAVYDDNGTLVNGSFQDYVMPRAEFLPEMELDETETPSPHNPLGAKGVGEAGTTGAPPTIVNAIVDALEPFGVEHLDMPITPEKAWRAMNDES